MYRRIIIYLAHDVSDWRSVGFVAFESGGGERELDILLSRINLAFQLLEQLLDGLVQSFLVFLLKLIVEWLLAENEHAAFELVGVSQIVQHLLDGLLRSLDVELLPVGPF